MPEKAPLRIATAPAGLALTLDGISQTAPVAYDELVGFRRTVDTPSPQFVGADRYAFGAWSDGGAQSHAFTVPAGGLTLAANFTLASTAPAGLVAAYGFDEGNGSTLYDASGKGRNGTLSGPIWAGAGRNGGALQFDGVNDFVRVDDHADLDLTTAMTLEAWVKPSALGTNWRTVLFKEQADAHDLRALRQHQRRPADGPGLRRRAEGRARHGGAAPPTPGRTWPPPTTARCCGSSSTAPRCARSP